MASPVFVGLPRRMLQMSIDGHDVQAMEGTTILDACRQLGIDTPVFPFTVFTDRPTSTNDGSDFGALRTDAAR